MARLKIKNEGLGLGDIELRPGVNRLGRNAQNHFCIQEPTVSSFHCEIMVDGAMAVALLLHLPLFLMFWHAPALVHWHGVAPVKSLFFSVVACLRNWHSNTLVPAPAA